MRWAALALLALTLTGCETTAEKSAKLERAAKQQEQGAERRAALARRGLSITRPNRSVRVVASTLLHTGSTTAVVLRLHNSSPRAQRDVPVQITVHSSGGSTLYTNRTAGQTPPLLAAALVPAHGEAVWIDDQVQIAGAPAGVTTILGEGRPVSGSVPQLRLEGVHHIQEAGGEAGAEGSVLDPSSSAESEVVIDAVVVRGGRVVAAGRAVLPQLPADTSTPFQLFFVGDPRGGQLQVSALPSLPAGS